MFIDDRMSVKWRLSWPPAAPPRVAARS